MNAQPPYALPDPLAGHPFARDYIAASPAARAFLPGPWNDTRQIAGWSTGTHAAPWSPGEIEELARFNADCGNPAGADLAQALGDAGTLTVVTGQQPSLLGGPLYVLLKALGACRLAAQLGALTGQPVVPVFWIASDDHDFAELRDCRIPGADGTIENVGRLVPPACTPANPTPAYTWSLAESRPRLLGRLRHLLGGGPAALQTLAAIEEAFAPPCTFESVFARVLSAHLHTSPMLFVAPRLGALRRRQTPVLQREIELAGETSRSVSRRGAELAAAGYPPIISRPDELLNCFLLLEGNIRARLRREGDTIHAETPAHPRIMTRSATELTAMLRESPDAFSPNVVTRPVVQDHALPNRAYVAGPGEISYFAQIAPVYSMLGVERCAIVPRPFATIIGRAGLQALPQPAAAIPAPGIDTPIEPLARTDPGLHDAFRAIDALEEEAARTLHALRSVPPCDHPHAVRGLDKTHRTIQQALGRLRRRIARRLAADGTARWPAALRAMQTLAPMGKPQERVLSPLGFAPGHTPDQLARAIVEALDAPQTAWPAHSPTARLIVL